MWSYNDTKPEGRPRALTGQLVGVSGRTTFSRSDEFDEELVAHSVPLLCNSPSLGQLQIEHQCLTVCPSS